MDCPKFIAHRGISALAPENTFAAFKLANQQGFKWIEFDVTLTADGIPIIFHDKTLKRQTGHQKKINQLSYPILEKIDIGSWFSSRFSHETIPTLEQLLIWAKQENMYLNLEIKPNGFKSKLLVRSITDLIQKTSFPISRLLVSSFDIRCLTYAKYYLPKAKRGLLMDKWRVNWLRLANRLAVHTVHCKHTLATKRRVKRIKQNGFLLFCYTVNNPKLADRLFHKGVDAVFSDNPKALKEARDDL